MVLTKDNSPRPCKFWLFLEAPTCREGGDAHDAHVQSFGLTPQLVGRALHIWRDSQVELLIGDMMHSLYLERDLVSQHQHPT